MFDIREDDLSGAATLELLAIHLAGMQASSPPDCCHTLDLSGLKQPNVTVWSASYDGNLAAIGALKILDSSTAEVKSMRTHPNFLRKGAGSAILDHIIAVAEARGIERLSLETGSGPLFEPALALYRRRGFKSGGAFSEYKEDSFTQFFHLELRGSRNSFGPSAAVVV